MLTKDVLYLARLHWILFFWPFVFTGFAIYLGLASTVIQHVALLFLVFGLIWILMTWVTYQFSSVTIKKNQIILCTGLFVRQTVDIPLAKIETIDIRQSVLGSLLRYGALVITGTGGTRHVINYLDKPLTCRRYIEQLMHDA